MLTLSNVLIIPETLSVAPDNPFNGLLYYDSTLVCLRYYSENAWISLLAGNPGMNGATWRSGSGAPSNNLGANGDYYLNTANSDVYLKSAGTYSVICNIKGAQGIQGVTGNNGTNGSDGATGAQGATGNTGATGSTGAQGPQGIQGSQGNTGSAGSTGAAGTDGATWRQGSGAPSNGTGVNGDFYFRTDTDDVYQKASGTYSIIANIKGSTGATGSTGSQGIQGIQGNVGAQGNPGADGTNYLTQAQATDLTDAGDSTLHYHATDRDRTNHTGVQAQSTVTNLVTNLAAKATDTLVVHNTGDETIAGVKTFSSTITGAVSGNAGSATIWATARTINGVSVNGSANVTITAAADTLTGTSLNSTIVGSSLTSVGTLVNLTVTNTITGAVSGNAGTVTNGVYITGNQVIGGTKTFSSPILADVQGTSLVNRNPAANVTVPANYSLILARKYTLAAGVKVSLGDGAILKII